MSMDSINDWEAKLKALGVPSEIPLEHEKAKEAGVDLVPLDMTSQEAQALSKKLQQEDPRNIFGGFPNSLDTIISLIETLKEEWMEQSVLAKDIHITIHSSCINDYDCVTVSYNGSNKYHYNTKNIRGYSRQEMISKLKSHNLFFLEKIGNIAIYFLWSGIILLFVKTKFSRP